MTAIVTTVELTVLRQLDDQRWRTAAELHDLLPVLHVQVIRSALKHLARNHLAERGDVSSLRWGRYRITGAGAAELRAYGATSQLQLVEALETATGQGRR